MSFKKKLQQFPLDIKQNPTGTSPTNDVVNIIKKKGLATKQGSYDMGGNQVDIGHGYQVSTRRPELTVAEADRIVHKNKKLRKYKRGVGYFKNESTGTIDPEPSLTVESGGEAMKIAKMYNQESIWNNRAGTDIKNPDTTWLTVDKKGRTVKTTIVGSKKQKQEQKTNKPATKHPVK